MSYKGFRKVVFPHPSVFSQKGMVLQGAYAKGGWKASYNGNPDFPHVVSRLRADCADVLGLSGARIGAQDPHCGGALSEADRAAVERDFVGLFCVEDFVRSVRDDINQQARPVPTLISAPRHKITPFVSLKRLDTGSGRKIPAWRRRKSWCFLSLKSARTHHP